MSTPLNRRAFCQSLAAALSAAAASAQPTGSEPAHAALAQLLGLQGEELRWLDALKPPQQRALLAALRAGGRPGRQTVDLLYRVIGRRERLFAYVGYPPLSNRLIACDGLIRE